MFITARPAQFKEKTREWLLKHLEGISFEVIHSCDFAYGRSLQKKHEVCLALDVDVMIEDDVRDAEGLLGRGSKFTAGQTMESKIRSGECGASTFVGGD